MDMNSKEFSKQFPIGAPVTVTDENDGTFHVRIGGKTFTRWPNREMAERRADAVRRYDAQHAKA
jgi:hypothetical protein